MRIAYADTSPKFTALAVPSQMRDLYITRLCRLMSSVVYLNTQGRIMGPCKHMYLQAEWTRWGCESRKNWDWLCDFLQSLLQLQPHHEYEPHLKTFRKYRLWFMKGELTPFPEVLDEKLN